MSENRCPVCGMDAADSKLTTEHIGIIYRFCSEQCLENFIALPRLYVGKGAQKAEGKIVAKRRTFMLDRPVPDAIILQKALLGMMGVKEVEITDTKVSVTYDLMEARAVQIEQVLAGAGGKLGQGWAERLKRNWVQYAEETELENLAAGDAPCCNRPPHS